MKQIIINGTYEVKAVTVKGVTITVKKATQDITEENQQRMDLEKARLAESMDMDYFFNVKQGSWYTGKIVEVNGKTREEFTGEKKQRSYYRMSLATAREIYKDLRHSEILVNNSRDNYEPSYIEKIGDRILGFFKDGFEVVRRAKAMQEAQIVFNK